jgi:hypothetical protein
MTYATCDKDQYINNQTSFTISDNYRINLLSTVANAPQNCLPKFCGIIFQISVNNYRNGKLLPKWDYGYLCPQLRTNSADMTSQIQQSSDQVISALTKMSMHEGSFTQWLHSCSKILHVTCSEMYLNTYRDHSQQRPLQRREAWRHEYIVILSIPRLIKWLYSNSLITWIMLFRDEQINWKLHKIHRKKV